MAGARRLPGAARGQQPVQRLLRLPPRPRHRRLAAPPLHAAPDRQRRRHRPRCWSPAWSVLGLVSLGDRGVLRRAARLARGRARRDRAVLLYAYDAAPEGVEGTRPRRGRRVRGVGPADDRRRLLRHHRSLVGRGVLASVPRPRGHVDPGRQARRPARSSTPASTSARCRCCSASAPHAGSTRSRCSGCTWSPRSLVALGALTPFALVILLAAPRALRALRVMNPTGAGARRRPGTSAGRSGTTASASSTTARSGGSTSPGCCSVRSSRTCSSVSPRRVAYPRTVDETRR